MGLCKPLFYRELNFGSESEKMLSVKMSFSSSYFTEIENVLEDQRFSM